ncbi:hypothetical protein AGDE_14677 [Angomonas deanei]|uniref:Uncharacterized protein n=1 Tax=Angomonas deanei TaxID=59799 RepID=A0A7G2CD41_9TRYP|nr:hypothetical protein AGDE_14677 [Angomonas deanei]CAD2217748.1 hypothetical protein, conserved [Angomonas deanei]|eukprot:EPY20432.1 hypothetical protein AGDE_14677 [Angomonas deanei]
MGCGGSKDKTKDKKNDKKDDPTTAQPPVEQAPAAEKKEEPRKEVEAPAGRAQEDHMDTASTAAPKRPARSGDVDEDGNPVVLPKGEWIKTERYPLLLLQPRESLLPPA